MNPKDKELIAALQRGLPRDVRPYSVLAAQLGMSESQLLERLRAMQADGRLRRMAGIVNQRQVGLQGNVMAVWDVPEERVESAGRYFAAQREVTHVYERPRQGQWPYNLYTMIHAADEEACSALIDRWRAELGIEHVMLCPTIREWKKSAPVYFPDDVAAAAGADGAASSAAPAIESLFPVMLRLAGRRCLIVGGGAVAARKAEDLKAAGARVVLVAPQVSAAAREAAVDELLERPYGEDLLTEVAVVIAATDDSEVNQRVLADCRRRGLWCNVVDVPELCDFIVPAVLRRGRLTLAVSTGGASPRAAAMVRDQVSKALAPNVDLWLDGLARVRARLLSTVADAALRRAVLLRLAEADVLAASAAGAEALAAKIDEILRQHGLPEGEE